MKTSLTYLKNHLVCFGAAVFLLASVSAAHAQILLDVQISGNVATITATGNVITIPDTNATVTIDAGVTLESFFQDIQGTLSFQNPINANSGSTLTGANISSPGTINTVQNDDINGFGSVPDLTLFSSTSTSTMTFATGSEAFTGTMTVDLTQFSGNLPSVGDSGTIVTSYSQAKPNIAIGAWQVVAEPSVSAPEPSSWMLLAVGSILLGVLRLRTRFVIRPVPDTSPNRL
jgi:hypothetical protein